MALEFVKFNPNEEIVGVVRQSSLLAWPRLALAGLWFLLPFFFFFPLLSLGLSGFAIFLALAASGMYVAFRTWLRWRNTVLFITNERVIDVVQQGLFDHEISDLALQDVSDVRVEKKGWIAKRLDLGVLTLETIKSSEFDLRMEGVSHSERVRDLILELALLSQGKTLPTEFSHERIAYDEA
ncbi:MAG: PH domain-containing protein [Patescibacteria group bacterium]|jgi:hypothetical protein